jgi:hypothetical protein
MNEGFEKGKTIYGDKYLSKSHNELLVDMQEECRDIANYCFMLWEKIERLKK